VCNFSPVVRKDYRVGLPKGGEYRELLNTDSWVYGGANVGNGGTVRAESKPWHGHAYSAPVVLPPLATVWLEAPH
jgi:1,4-alpha-glucan branching enzyme